MEWTKEQCLLLIAEYEKHPVLCDAKHAFHFSKLKKIDAWEAISKEMEVSTEDCRQKMLSLLGSFKSQRAKSKKSVGTGKGK